MAQHKRYQKHSILWPFHAGIGRFRIIFCSEGAFAFACGVSGASSRALQTLAGPQHLFHHGTDPLAAAFAGQAPVGFEGLAGA